MMGSEMEEAETIFIPCRRILLLTLSKRLVSTSWPPKINTSLCPFSICSALVVTCPIVFCMFLLMLRKRLETTRMAIDTMGASTIRINDSCQLYQNIRTNRPMIEAPSRTTVMSALEEEDATCSES